MPIFDVTIKRTFIRVVKVEADSISEATELAMNYGVVEAYSDFPEDESKAQEETKITKIVKVKRGAR